MLGAGGLPQLQLPAALQPFLPPPGAPGARLAADALWEVGRLVGRLERYRLAVRPQCMRVQASQVGQQGRGGGQQGAGEADPAPDTTRARV